MPDLLDPVLLVVLALGIGTGGLIGAVGVGGVLLAPLLILVAGYEAHAAVAVASWSFLFTGVAGTLAYARRGSVDLGAAAWLTLTVAPAAVAGAWAIHLVPAAWLVVILCALVLASGLRSLLAPNSARTRADTMPSARILAILGGAVGFGSALTGTGGPVLLIPLLLLARVPALAAVAVSQVVQLPVAVFASIGHGLFGDVDVVLATALGLTQAAGVIVGAHVAHALPRRRLERVVAGALLATALVLLARLAAAPT